MQLEEYIGKEKYLDGIVQYHQSRFKFDDLKERIFMQLYLGRIPYQIHDEIGYFDYFGMEKRHNKQNHNQLISM